MSPETQNSCRYPLVMNKYYTLSALLLLINPLSAQDAIEKELEALRWLSLEILERIDALEKKKAAPSLKTTNAKLQDPLPSGRVQPSSKETNIILGGRIQLDTYIGSDDNPDATFNAKYKTEKSSRSNQLSTHAKSSRLWLKTVTNTKYGLFKSLVESDFYSGHPSETNSNSYALRLRHAYVSMNNLHIGQTNSLFTTLYTPELLVDPVNETYARQPLISWFYKPSQKLSYDLSLEQPETTLINSSSRTVTISNDTVPDIVLRNRYFSDQVEFSNALILRHLIQDSAYIGSDEVFGWGINSSAKLFFQDHDDLRFSVQYGKGLGRYIAENAFSAGEIDKIGNIRLHKTYGAHISFRHWWNENLRSTIAYSLTGIEGDYTNRDIFATRKATSAHINFIWNPLANTLAGLEYAHLYTKDTLENTQEYDLFKLRFSYNF